MYSAPRRVGRRTERWANNINKNEFFSRKTCATTMETTAAAAAVASVLTGFYVRKISVGDSTSPTRGRDALRVIDKAAKLHHSTAREQTLKPSTNQKKGWRSDNATLSVTISRRWVPVDTVHRFLKGEVVGGEHVHTNQLVSTNPDVRVHEAVLRQRWSSTWTVQHCM